MLAYVANSSPHVHEAEEEPEAWTLFGLLGADHHFGDEVDDGTCRLLGVMLCEKMTHILHAAPTFPRYKAKDPV